MRIFFPKGDKTFRALGLLFMLLALLYCRPASKMDYRKSAEATSLLGEPLYAPAPEAGLLDRYKQYKVDFLIDTTNVEKLIWFGRFAGYTGAYQEAIAIYSRGIRMYPEDPRLYRHRGHRYISVRAFDKAIEDLEFAAQLIDGKPNEIEPDGLPNAQNIPVSTLHGNIWYHLGLAYYLKQDMESALGAYKRALAATENDDNIVSTTHWIYMILRRLGRVEEADTYLEAIHDRMNVIENLSYYRACLMYKGVLKVRDLQGELENSSSGDALTYALGNWYFYNGEEKEAKSLFRNLLGRKTGWASFGYIAAESDWNAHFESPGFQSSELSLFSKIKRSNPFAQ